MDSRRLTYFLTVAEEGSINRAAAVLGIAQPALSRQVRLLEDELGTVLLRRTARGVQLTEDGERLRAATAGPLRQLELAMRYAGSPLARVQRALRLGIVATAELLAVPLLDSLSAAFGLVDFRVTVAGADDLTKELLRGAIDMAVTVPVADDRLFHGDLIDEELVAVGRPDTGLRNGVPISFADLARLPLVLPASRAGVRASVENAALRQQHTVTSRVAVDSVAAMSALVAEGHGVAVLPPSACRAHLDPQRLVQSPIVEPTLTQRLAIGVTGHTDLPRGFTRKVSEVMRDEVVRLVRAGTWPARLIEET